MKIAEYFNSHFQSELRQMEFREPNFDNLQSFGIDHTTIFYGGREWENCEIDLQVSSHKSHFALSLFAMVCNDVNMHTNFNEHYSKFRNLNNYPKFGWSGFGPHFESPDWLLEKPLALGQVSFSDELLKDFVALWKQTAEQFFAQHMPEIKSTEFFEKLVTDIVFEKSDVLLKIKEYLVQDIN